MSRFSAIALGGVLLVLVTGCPRPVATSVPANVLRGEVEFGVRQVQASMDEIANGATVSLIDAQTGITASTAKTNPDGTFALTFPTGFQPGVGPYYLEAVKGLSDLTSLPNRAGAAAARVRTVASWQSGWSTISSGSIRLSPSTTALSAIASLKGLSQPAILGLLSSLSVGTADNSLQPPTPDSFAPGATGITNQEYHTVWGLVTDALGKDLDPLGTLSYANGAFADSGNQSWMLRSFRQGSKTNVAVAEAGYVQLGFAVPPAPVPKSANEEAYFAAQGMSSDGAGTLAGDGTYLYAKAWAGYANTTANAHVFKRIGTGFNGTTRGQNYGTVGGVTDSSLTAFWWGGYLFNPGSTLANNQLARTSVSTGTQETLTLQDPQMSRHSSSLSGGGSYLTTSDGTYAYNLAYDDNGSGYDLFKVRVLDPANGFGLVRELVLDNATSSYYTDGLWCDGIYLYPIEWTASDARLRRYRLSDGRLDASWTFSQQPRSGGDLAYSASNNDPISGHYDWVNNKFWIGNLNNDSIHLIKGGVFQATGTYVSPGFDTGKASRLRTLYWGADVPSGTGLTFQVRSADTREGLESVAWYGPTSTTDSYTTSGQAINAILSGKRWVQVKAVLTTTDTATRTPRLRWLEVAYQ